MRRFAFHGVWVFATAMLVACGGGGGGGGGGSTVPAPVASTSTFQLRTAYATTLTQAGTQGFSLRVMSPSGTTTTTGSGTLTIGPLSPSTFEGVSARQLTISFNGSTTSSGVVTPLSTIRIGYVDANLLPLGSSGSDYQVTVGAVSIPITAKVGMSGPISTTNRYSDSSKITVLGTDTESYSLDADTATTALLKVVVVSKDAIGSITDTTIDLYRVTPSGAMTRISMITIYSNGSTAVTTF